MLTVNKNVELDPFSSIYLVSTRRKLSLWSQSLGWSPIIKLHIGSQLAAHTNFNAISNHPELTIPVSASMIVVNWH